MILLFPGQGRDVEPVGMHSLRQSGLLTEEAEEIPSMAQKLPVCLDLCH